jgi:putative hydrolase of the HAD superfamily
MIGAVLFDYGGVIVGAGRRGFNKVRMAELLEREQEDLHELFVPGGPYWRLNRGLIAHEDFWGSVQLRAGVALEPERRDELWNRSEILEPQAEVLELARELRERGIATGILSNVVTPVAELLHDGDHYADFHPVILSCEVGYAKPDPEIYHRALEALGLPGSEVLFIDDQIENLAPAQALGMRTILAETGEQIAREARELIAL